MVDHADSLRCAGRQSPVRPATVVPVCKTCPLWLPMALAGEAMRPAAKHNGTQWQCERRQQAADAEA